MGFKINSLDKVNSAATELSNQASSFRTRQAQTTNTLSELGTQVSGGNIEQELSNLKEMLASSSEKISTRVQEVSQFIASQVQSYTNTQADASSSLQNIQSALEGLED